MLPKEFTFDANNYPLEPGIRLIEASAGTGKTFSLVHLILRLLTEKRHSIKEILVVSFTRATASEIKVIIGERILLAIKILESWGVHKSKYVYDDVLKEWLNNNIQDDETRLYWSTLLLTALEDLDQADITTIHGFCLRTLKRESIESGSHIKPLLQVDDHELITEIAYEYWIKEVLNLDSKHIKSIHKLGLTVENLAENLLKIVNDPSLNFHESTLNLDKSKPLNTQFNKLFNDYWTSFCTSWRKEGALLEQDLKDYSHSLRIQGITDTKPFSPKPRKDRHKILSKWIEQFTFNSLSNNNTFTPFYEDIINQKGLIAEYYHPQNLYRLQSRHNLEDKCNFRPDLQEAISKLWDGPVEIIWNHGLSWCLHRLQERKLETSTISNRDLMKALDPDSYDKQPQSNQPKSKFLLFEKLRSRYKVALIDEFQDTDPIQWRILKEIFSNSNMHLMIMVGDPKQAIYKFRGGDLNTYIRARKEVERIDSLSANFRTTPLLMKGLNQLMSMGLKRSSLKVPTLIARSDKKTLRLSPDEYPLQILEITNNLLKSKQDDKLIETKSSLEEKVTNIVAHHLLDLLKKHCNEIRPEDICVLVNNHNQAENIRKQLAIAGLPSRLVTKGNIFKSDASEILQRFINCLAKPGDSGELKLLACTNLLKWSISELELSEKDGSLDQLANRFSKWSKNLKKIGLIGCLSEILEGRAIADLSERGRLLSDLNQCAQLVQEEMHRQGFDAKGAARWLKKQRNSHLSQIPENHLPKSDITENSINILTIHRSKGLQYKVVLCPFLWQSPLQPKGPLWRLDGEERWLLKQSPHLNNDISLSEEAKFEALKEYERLAYVAMTRAEQQLILIWGKALKQEGNPLISFLFGPNEIDTRIEELTHEKMIKWLAVNNAAISIFPAKSSPINTSWTKTRLEKTLELGPTPKRSLDKEWGRYSYSSWISNSDQGHQSISYSPEIEEGLDIDHQKVDVDLKATKTKRISIEDSPNTNISVTKNNPLVNFPVGTLAGDCLHRILEKLDFQADINSQKNSTLIVEELRKAGIDIELSNSVKEGLNRVLKIGLGRDLRFLSFNRILSRNRIHEMRFDLPIANLTSSINSKDISMVFNKNPNARFGSSYAKEVNNLAFSSKGFLTGSIDLVFADDEDYSIAKWWVTDWKSNWLGNRTDGLLRCGPEHYDNKAMDEQMLLHHYPLQAHLYLVALHRLLKWRLPNYSPHHHLGGYIYVFLRGIPASDHINRTLRNELLPGLIIEKAPVERVLELDNIIGEYSQ